MSARGKNMENEIVSLASTIKKSMVDPAGQRLRNMEDRLAAVERSVILLNRAFLGAAVMIAASIGTIFYYLL